MVILGLWMISVAISTALQGYTDIFFKLVEAEVTFSKVLITCRFNDRILGDHFLVHEGCVIMMFYVPQEPKSGHPKFYD
jgi:hypothetical protein